MVTNPFAALVEARKENIARIDTAYKKALRVRNAQGETPRQTLVRIVAEGTLALHKSKPGYQFLSNSSTASRVLSEFVKTLTSDSPMHQYYFGAIRKSYKVHQTIALDAFRLAKKMKKEGR